MAATWDELREEARPWGDVRAEFPPTPRKRIASQGWGLLILALGVMFVTISLVVENLSPRNRPPNPEGDRIGRILFAGGGSVLSVGGLGLLWTAFRTRSNGVLVLADGLCFWCHGKTITCSWDDIEEVWWKVHLADAKAGMLHKTLWINLRDGQKLKCGSTIWVFPHLVMDEAALDGFYDMVERERARRQLPNLLHTLAAGSEVPFSKLVVNREGVTWKSKSIPWGRIRWIERCVRPWFLVGPFRWSLITTNGPELTMSLNRIPNVALFWALAEEVQKELGSVSNPPPL